MASFLDVVLLSNFAPIFVLILVFAVTYGILEFAKPFGKDKQGLRALIALITAIISAFSPAVTGMIMFSVPWFIVIMIFYFFIVLILKLFGGESVDFSDVLRKDKRVMTYTIIFAIIILLFGLGGTLGQKTLEKGGWVTLENGTRVRESSLNNGMSATDQFIEETGVGNNDVTGTRVATNDFGTNLLNTLVNPKVLGMVLVMLVGAFAMFFLAND